MRSSCQRPAGRTAAFALTLEAPRAPGKSDKQYFSPPLRVATLGLAGKICQPRASRGFVAFVCGGSGRGACQAGALGGLLALLSVFALLTVIQGQLEMASALFPSNLSSTRRSAPRAGRPVRLA